ncbi:hypothetical protein Tco_1501615, partial [Tanacetum coccineum]
MDQDSAHMVAASKVPMLKPGEYEIWRMRIEQYIQMIDYALWEVIENGATLPKTKIVEGVMTEMPITTAEEKAQRRLEDAKKLMEAVEKRFGGNSATRKTQRNLLKQLQKLVSQLELLDEKLSQEDVNLKLLRSLSPKWNTHVVVWRNKVDLDKMSMDDLYNNLKVYEPEVKGMSSSSLSTQNMAFVSSSNNNTSSTNESVNTAHGASTASTQSDQAEEGPNYALMAFSSSSHDSEVSNDSICLKSCLETVKLLKSQNDQLLKDLKKSELMVLGFKTGLESVEEKL